MTKDEAQQVALRRWHELPPAERKTPEQAQVFAASLADDLDFRTMGNERKVIAAWLVRDIEAGETVPRALEAGEQKDDTEAEDSESPEQFGPPQPANGDGVVGAGETAR